MVDGDEDTWKPSCLWQDGFVYKHIDLSGYLMIATDQLAAPAEPSSTGLDLGQVLKRRKLLLVLGIAVGAGLAYLYFIRQPPEFMSVARVLVTQKQGQNLPIESAGFVYKNSLNNELLLIGSEDILGSAFNSLRSESETAPFKSPGELKSGLLAKQIEGTDIIEISYKGKKAEVCQKAVESVTTAYTSHVRKSKEASHVEIKTLMNELVNKVTKQLQEANGRYEVFHQNAELNTSAGQATNPHLDRRNVLESRLIQAELKEAELKTQIDSIQRSSADSSQRLALEIRISAEKGGTRGRVTPNSARTGEFRHTSLTEQIFKIGLELDRAKEKYGVKHPKVAELIRQKAFMTEFLERQESSEKVDDIIQEPVVDIVQIHLDSLNQELAELNEVKSKIKSKIDVESAAAKSLGDVIRQSEILWNDIQALRTTQSELQRRLAEMELVQEYEGRDAVVIEPAKRGSQVGPDFAKIMAIGSILGLLAGFGLACLIELADKSFRSPDDLMAELGIPVLSHIPFMREAKKRRVESGVGNALITVLRPKSRTAEAYRSVRTALYFSTSGEVNKIVQVTSPVAGDGKSTLAGNLAVAIAHSGKRVLLLDADLRRPTVHKVFGLSNKQGVSTVVSGNCPLQDATHDTEVENLSILTCGPRPDNPSEMLLSPEFEQLLEYVRAAFDFVVIDSPPILAVTDPASVAARADGVIVTLRLAKRSRDLAKRAVDQLQNVGANILGVVVNGVDSVETYGYRSYSYGGYGYGGYGQGYGGYYANQSGYYDEASRPGATPKRIPAATTQTNGKS